jgi:hypothetical protein
MKTIIKTNPITSEQIMPLLTFVFQYIGWHIPEAEQLATIAKHCAIDINMLHGNLYRDELPLVFNLGAKGELGEFKTISGKTINDWVKVYKRSEHRSQWLRDNVMMLARQSEVKIERVVDYPALWKRMKADWQRYGTFMDGGGIMYRHMVGRGIIPADAWELHKDSILADLRSELTITATHGRRFEIQGIIEQLTANSGHGTIGEQRCRHQVLMELMQQGIEI